MPSGPHCSTIDFPGPSPDWTTPVTTGIASLGDENPGRAENMNADTKVEGKLKPRRASL